MNKKISLVLIFLLFISFASVSFGIVETMSAFPVIKIQFSKTTYPDAIVLVNQSSIQLNLTESLGNSHDLEFLPAFDGVVGSYFEVQPLEPLMNDNYTLKIFAKDILNNNVSTSINLTVDVPYMDMWVSNPPLSVSPQPVFDLSIGTAENAYDCRYSAFFKSTYGSAPGNFLDTTPIIHTKANFNNVSVGTPFPLANGIDTPIYVFCRDSNANRINPKILQISFDTTKPVISVSADPQIVTEKTSTGKVVAQIKVSTGDKGDKVVCRYSNVELSNRSTNDSIVYVPIQSNFVDMPFNFTALEDENNESKYTTTPVTTIDLTSFVTDIAKKYTFTGSVACINRATFDLASYGTERVSITKNVTVIVNLLSPMTITKTSPPAYQSNGTIFLNFTTNRAAICNYDFNGTNGTFSSTADNKLHTSLLSQTYLQGNYNLIVNCIGENSKTENYQIVVDTSAPTGLSIISPNATCTKSLSAKFSANDSESGISGYNYSIVGIGVNASGETTSDSVTESNLNLSNQTQYYFKATATNRAGLTSSEVQGNYIVYDDTGLSCDVKPPAIFLKKNNTDSGVYVTFVCVDDLECKNDSYMYYLSADSSCQGVFQSVPYIEERQSFGVLLSQGGYFCYEAEDMARNKAKGYEKITFESLASCYNSVEDAGETDVDCGGNSTCERCGENKKCAEDLDCISRYCSGGICIQSSCSDLMKNGYESDVDCGGLLCPKCSINKTCIVNSDCMSAYCNSGGVCDSPSCNDTVENGNESDVDCGGNCRKCGLGKFCLINSDCQSGICSIGKCVQQLIEKNETQQPESTGGSILFKILKIIFLMLGVLGIFGGSGYMYYKKSLPKKPVVSSTPSKTTSLSEAREAAAKPKQLTADEKIKKLTIQEQLRREQEEKQEKRDKLFGVFGAPRTISKQQPVQPAKPLVAPARRIVIPTRPSPATKKQEAPRKEGLFEQLGKMVPKKDEDIFSRLGKLKGETEFEKLEKMGRGKKAEDIEKLKRKKK